MLAKNERRKKANEDLRMTPQRIRKRERPERKWKNEIKDAISLKQLGHEEET